MVIIIIMLSVLLNATKRIRLQKVQRVNTIPQLHQRPKEVILIAHLLISTFQTVDVIRWSSVTGSKHT